MSPRPGPPHHRKFSVVVPLASQGMSRKGNIDIYNRPITHNPPTADNPFASVSTFNSVSSGYDDGEVLYPGVRNDRPGQLSRDEAARQYEQSGLNFGTFPDTPQQEGWKAADRYGENLHNEAWAWMKQIPLDGFNNTQDALNAFYASRGMWPDRFEPPERAVPRILAATRNR